VRPGALRALWLLSLALFAAATVWQSLRVNLGYHLRSTPQLSGRWQPAGTDYLLDLASSQLGRDPARAIRTAGEALTYKPVDARTYLFIGLARELGRLVPDAEMAIVDEMGPRMPDNQLDLAAYWSRRGDGSRALAHWGAALQARPELATGLFPVMLQVAQTGRYRAAFAELAAADPKWWPGFFGYVMARGGDESLVRELYLARAAAGEPPRAVRVAYTDYLIGRHRALEAYALWLDNLDPEQTLAVGYLNDGEFNHAPSGEGFGWRFGEGEGMDVARVLDEASGSNPALRVSLWGHRIASNTLASQRLMLPADSFELTGRVLLESVNAGEGLRWSATCLDGRPIGRGAVLSGTAPWADYRVRFSVPDEVGCETQVLMLESVPGGVRPFDYQGAAWFDHLVIRKATNLVDVGTR